MLFQLLMKLLQMCNTEETPLATAHESNQTSHHHLGSNMNFQNTGNNMSSSTTGEHRNQTLAEACEGLKNQRV
jgi:hypothetical protein